jgi:hypothetical protein
LSRPSPSRCRRIRRSTCSWTPSRPWPPVTLSLPPKIYR